MGRNCVREALRACPDQIKRIFFAEGRGGSSKGRDDRLEELQRLVSHADIPSEIIAPDELSALVNSDSHQSVAALMSSDRTGDLKELLSATAGDEPALLLLLDSINDPQNLGAILRAAECFGAHGVVWSKNRGAPLTPAASKASVGASELVPIAQVANLAEAARKIKDEGFWLVGAAVGEGASDLYEFEFPRRTALVLGAEESGIHDLLLRLLDFKVYIPMRGSIDSLNVSQACSVMLSAYRGGERV